MYIYIVYIYNFFRDRQSFWNGHVLCSEPRCCQHVFDWSSVSWELSRSSQTAIR